MRYLTADQFDALLTDQDYFELVETAFRIYGREREVFSRPAMAPLIVPHDTPSLFGMKGASAMSLGVAGCFFGAQFGDYYFTVHDSRTGTLLGIVEQARATKRRTAATAVVTAAHLAAPNSRIAAIIGAGRIAEQIALTLPQRFALDDMRIVSRTMAGAEALVDRLPAGPARAVEDAARAVRGADIVVTITLASQPMIRPGWLKPGALLCSLGGVHEVEFGVLAEIDRLVVDELDYALLRGDFPNWIRRGEITRGELEARIDADIGEVVLGSKPGRTGGDQRIMAVIQGMAVCDLVIAQAALDRAAAGGIGSVVDSHPQIGRPEPAKLAGLATRIATGLKNSK